MHVSFASVGVAVALLCVGCSRPMSPTTPTSVQSATTADHVTHDVPFKGDLEGLVTLHFDSPPLTWWFMSGSGNATKLGRFAVTVTSRLGSGITHGGGLYTLTAANGDTLNGFFEGRGEGGPSTFSIVEDVAILGGSGRFSGGRVGRLAEARRSRAMAGGEAGIRILRTRLSNLVMARDFWS